MKTHKILGWLFVCLLVAVGGSAVACSGVLDQFAFSHLATALGHAGSVGLANIAGVAVKTNHRAVFNQMKRDHPGAIITDSYIRCEASLQGSITQVRFNTLTNEGSMNVTERRLSITDKFCVTQLGVFLMKAGTTATATQAQIAGGYLRTWENPQVFTGANEAVALHNLYNGYLQVRIDSTVYFDALDMHRFYRVPTSQKGFASTLTPGAAQLIQQDGWDILNYGFCPVDPTFTMSGRGKNDITINLPTSVDTSGTSSQNFAVLIARGFLMQNAAKNS